MTDQKADEATVPVDPAEAKSPAAEGATDAPIPPATETPPATEAESGGSSIGSKLENMVSAVKQKFSSSH